MKIENSNINFKAVCLNRTKVSKREKGNYVPCDASFILLEKECENDNIAINKLSELWKYASFMERIQMGANWRFLEKFKNIKIYALTTQRDDFEEIKPELMLGIAEVRENELNNKKAVLWYLQVDPMAINVDTVHLPRYKGCGSAVLQSLKKIYNTIGLKSVGTEPVNKFYKDNGFKNLLFTNRFTWNAGILNRILKVFRNHKLSMR